jgi:hypothetical protein
MEERDTYAPIKGKCKWWREAPVLDDIYDNRLKPEERTITCSCFVEGKGWVFTRAELPAECPDAVACRYYIRNV